MNRNLLIAIAALIIAGSNAMKADAQTPPALTLLVGKWACNGTDPNGKTIHSRFVFTQLNPYWVENTGEVKELASNRALTTANWFGYDPQSHNFVGIHISSVPGDYSVAIAHAPATAMVMTFVQTYPRDPTHERDTFTYGKNALIRVSTWTQNGAARQDKDTCTRQ